MKQPDTTTPTEPVTEDASPPPMCDVTDCAEDAVTALDGRLRLNPQCTPALWIAVEFNLCAAHEVTHDLAYGESRSVSMRKKTKRQP